MELFLNANVPGGKKVGHRDPKNNIVDKKFVYILFPDKGTDVPTEIAKIMLAQNPHLVRKNKFKPPKKEDLPNTVVNPGASENDTLKLEENQVTIADQEKRIDELLDVNQKLRDHIKSLTKDKTTGRGKDDPDKKTDKAPDEEAEKNTAATEATKTVNENLSDQAQKTLNPEKPTGPDGQVIADMKMDELIVFAKQDPVVTMWSGITKLELIAECEKNK